MKTIFSEEGDIRSVDILAALVTLWREGSSGALHFSRSGATAGFQLSAGEVTSATSSDARFETAAILMRAGKLENATIERLVTPQGGDRALAALHAGILTKREWRWGEKIRAVEVLSDLLTWIEGDYLFDRGAHAEAGEFRLTVPRLILELFLRSRDRGLILHYLGGADVPLVRAPHFEAEFAAFGLTADAEAVVRLIDGKATAAHIASEGPAEPFAVEKLLAALVTLGLVYPEYVAPEGALQGVAEGALKGVAEGARRVAPEGALQGVPEAPPQEDAPPRSTEVPRPVPEETEPGETAAEEVSAAAEEEELDEEDEDYGRVEEERIGEPPAPYSELDVPSPSSTSSAAELDEDMEELDRLEAPADLPADSRIGDYEIADAGTEESEPAEAVYPGDAEPALEYAPGEPEAGAGREGSELSGPTSLEPESKSRLPLDYATGIGSEERPRPRSGARWLWLLVLLAAGVGAVILLRGHGVSGPTRVAATRESPTPVPVPTEEAAIPPAMPSAVPTEPPRVAAPTTAQPRIAATTIAAPKATSTSSSSAAARAPAAPQATARPVPTARPVATPPAASAQTAQATAPAAAEPPGSSRQAWLDRAARDLHKANADHRNHFAIQLELACETQTLVDAWKHDRPSGTMWVLTSPYEGKTCFRVLWGRYPSKDAARRALAGVPAFFSADRNRPVVTAIR